MTQTFGTSPAAAPAQFLRKTNARVALFNLPETSSSLLTECFRQFAFDTVPLSPADAERLRKQKFDACVFPLGESVGKAIELARNSASNNRLVIYGLGGSAQDALRYSKYCINAVFHEPLERSAALKLVRSTRPLVLHEFRRYVRVPVITDVSVVAADGTRLSVASQEISSGGMSLKGTAHLEPGQLVEVSFGLLNLPRIWVRGHVTWKKPNKSVGLRFDVNDERRRRVKEWIVAYLES
ncbi:MAG: PilZ domain-containing protein [Terriglobales bacterium]